MGDERHSLKLLLPLIGNLDYILLNVIASHRISLPICKLYNVGHVLRVNRVPHIVHVGTTTRPTLGVLIGEVLSHPLKFYYLLV